MKKFILAQLMFVSCTAAQNPQKKPAEDRADVQAGPFLAIRRSAFQVVGGVNHPGSIDFNGERVTVSMAISRAGSYTKFALPWKVVVLRQSAPGKLECYAVDLDSYFNKPFEDIELEPGDVVVVPERHFPR
jgi:protein involved in polysaccharide export with SLBB domain